MALRDDARVTIFERYLKHHAALDLEVVLGLFAADAIVEDPVGSRIHRGIEAIRDFYRETHRRNGRLEIEAIGPVLLGGEELAAHVRARLLAEGAPPAMDVIYNLRFDDSGQIVSLRAFF